VTRVYNFSAESSSSLRFLASLTRSLYGTFLQWDTELTTMIYWGRVDYNKLWQQIEIWVSLPLKIKIKTNWTKDITLISQQSTFNIHTIASLYLLLNKIKLQRYYYTESDYLATNLYHQYYTILERRESILYVSPGHK